MEERVLGPNFAVRFTEWRRLRSRTGGLLAPSRLAALGLTRVVTTASQGGGFGLAEAEIGPILQTAGGIPETGRMDPSVRWLEQFSCKASVPESSGASDRSGTATFVEGFL